MAKKETNTKLEVAICDLKGIDSIKIESLIRVIRGQQVMLDSDLAMLYGVETRTLNQAVKRNIKRFPEDFMFQLTKEEANHSRSQIVILNNDELSSRSQIATLNTQRGQNIKYLPYAFTRNGIAMLSSVLRSDTAVEVNIRIMRAFTMIPQLVNSKSSPLVASGMLGLSSPISFEAPDKESSLSTIMLTTGYSPCSQSVLTAFQRPSTLGIMNNSSPT